MKRNAAKVGLLGVVLAAGLSPLYGATYQIDPAHSGVTFRVRHLVSKVTGRFEKFEGTFDYDAKNLKVWKASATIETGSINTNMDKRDQHLRSAEFFDADRCPAISFVSAQVTAVKGNKAKLHGNLNMHCIAQPVVLDLEIGGVAKDPWGNQRAGAIATAKLNRKDWGLLWNAPVEAGGFLVGDEVEIILEIEGVLSKQ